MGSGPALCAAKRTRRLTQACEPYTKQGGHATHRTTAAGPPGRPARPHTGPPVPHAARVRCRAPRGGAASLRRSPPRFRAPQPPPPAAPPTRPASPATNPHHPGSPATSPHQPAGPEARSARSPRSQAHQLTRQAHQPGPPARSPAGTPAQLQLAITHSSAGHTSPARPAHPAGTPAESAPTHPAGPGGTPAPPPSPPGTAQTPAARRRPHGLRDQVRPGDSGSRPRARSRSASASRRTSRNHMNSTNPAKTNHSPV